MSLNLDRINIAHKGEEDIQSIDDNFQAIENEVNSHMADFASLLSGGQTFTATLQNGWTGNLYYSKNDLGEVWLRGNIKAGTIAMSTVITVLPTAYRPYYGIPLLSYSTSLGRIGLLGAINPAGEIQIRNNWDSSQLGLVSDATYSVNAFYNYHTPN